MPFATVWMDLETYEISQKGKYDLTYMWNLKNKTLSSYKKQIGGCQRQGLGDGQMGNGVKRYKLLRNAQKCFFLLISEFI